MKVIHAASELEAAPRRVCLAIGVFDGIHLGHQQVIRQTITDARQHQALSIVITFDRHPNSVVAPDRIPPLIFSLSQKLRVIASLGVEATLLIRFDRAFSEQSGERFVRDLARDFREIHSICVGSDFTFGHRRTGNIALLKNLGQELRFAVRSLAAVSLDGTTVSSTRIREAVRQGDLDAASQMLGRAYSIAGPVVKGDQLGGQLGFPTANLDVAGLVLPPDGVYAAHARVQENSFSAVRNIGLRPTLQDSAPQRRFEVHLLDFNADIYGQEIEVAFVEKLRDEQKFPSIEALRAQISRDTAAARQLLG